MNQHLPPSNVKPIDWQPEDFQACPEGLRTTAPVKPVEQYLLLAGKKEPWVFGDLTDRSGIIEEVADNFSVVAQIVAYSLEAGTCRDATDDICNTVIDRWAQDEKVLTDEQYEWVELRRGTVFANAFRRGAA